MQDAIASTPPRDSRASSLFVELVRRVLMAWAIGLVFVTAIAGGLDRGLIVPAMLVSVASGFVAILALMPVAWFVRSAVITDFFAGQVKQSAAISGFLVSAFSAGIALRLFGTVVLFLLCRYQMGLQPEVIAALVGGWYVLMTSVEVFSIARFNTDLHRSVVELRPIAERDSQAFGVESDFHRPAHAHSPLTEK